MKVYTTKYALTAGIEIVDVRYGAGDDGKYVYRRKGALEQFQMGNNAFLTWTEAAVMARGMRNRRQQSLQTQLKRVSGLIFPAREPKS